MMTELASMTDEALVAETKRAAETERRSTVELLRLLIEVERRALHLALGYSSMFAYCTRALLLSEQAAYKRITAARAAIRYPAMLQRLAEGAVTLSSVKVLAPHLTDENVDALLDAARHKSTREVEQLIATVYPQPDVPSRLRALPEPKAPADAGQLEAPGLLSQPAEAPAIPATQSCLPVHAPRPIVAPLSARRYLLRVTVDQKTHDKLQRARALLRHVVPDGDLGAVLDRALTLLLREAERTKWASAKHPRRPRQASAGDRYVPASVRRAVWSRDEGCCAFVGRDGRCGETGFLEFHHVVPFSVGGRTDEENLELRCRAHNQHEAVAAGIG
jgi:5-methylcytosine-specific restriction endonuclease McrA